MRKRIVFDGCLTFQWISHSLVVDMMMTFPFVYCALFISRARFLFIIVV